MPNDRQKDHLGNRPNRLRAGLIDTSGCMTEDFYIPGLAGMSAGLDMLFLEHIDLLPPKLMDCCQLLVHRWQGKMKWYNHKNTCRK